MLLPKEKKKIMYWERLCMYVCMYLSMYFHVHGFLSSVKMYLQQHFWHLVKPIGAHFCLIFPIELFLVWVLIVLESGFLGGTDSKECLQCRGLRFDPWIGKSPWRREWLTTPVVLPEELRGQRSQVDYSSWSCQESDRTEWLWEREKALGSLYILS